MAPVSKEKAPYIGNAQWTLVVIHASFSQTALSICTVTITVG